MQISDETRFNYDVETGALTDDLGTDPSRLELPTLKMQWIYVTTPNFGEQYLTQWVVVANEVGRGGLEPFISILGVNTHEEETPKELAPALKTGADSYRVNTMFDLELFNKSTSTQERVIWNIQATSDGADYMLHAFEMTL